MGGPLEHISRDICNTFLLTNIMFGFGAFILKGLREVFPRIQFMVTTDSTQILSTVRRENIRVMTTDVNGMIAVNLPLSMTYSEPIDNY